MKDNRKVLIEKERKVSTYAHLWRSSKRLLDKGKNDPKGSFHQFMASLVFTAFTLEAYLNHIGPMVFQCWLDLERLGPKEKLNVLAERLDVSIDYGKRPWQVMKDLFEFRNDIAHGKSTVVSEKKEVPIANHSDEQVWEFAQTKWEKYCTECNAVRAREDVERIVHLLHEAGKFKNDYPFVTGIQQHSATVVE